MNNNTIKQTTNKLTESNRERVMLKNDIIYAHKRIYNQLGVDMKSTEYKDLLLKSTVGLFGCTGTFRIFEKLKISNNMDDIELISTICNYKIETVEKKSLDNTLNKDKIKAEEFSLLLYVLKKEKDILLKSIKNKEKNNLLSKQSRLWEIIGVI